MTEVTPDNAARETVPLTRYALKRNSAGDAWLSPEPWGRWVEYADHAATVTALEAEVERWKSRYDDAMQARADEQKRADAAERRVAELEQKAGALVQSMYTGDDSRGHFVALKRCLAGALVE